MKTERVMLPQLIADYTEATRQAEKFGFLVRDTELQAEQIASLTSLKDRIKEIKYAAIRAKDERAANILFHLQCGLNAQISFLRVWIHLKEGKFYRAWDSLVDTQEYISIAMRSDENGVGLEQFLERLRRVEEVVFPGYRLYNSWGVVMSGGKCSICGRAFSECDHIEGLVYWGRLCVRAAAKFIRMDHVALVDEPRDRRCVITEITTDDGYFRDYMTWKKTKPAGKKEQGVAGKMTAKIFDFNMLEID